MSDRNKHEIPMGPKELKPEDIKVGQIVRFILKNDLIVSGMNYGKDFVKKVWVFDGRTFTVIFDEIQVSFVLAEVWLMYDYSKEPESKKAE